MVAHLLLAASTFAVTNIDDLVILSMYFADARYTKKTIVTGQFCGILFLTAVSLTGLFAQVVIPERWIGLLGVFPIFLGVRDLLRRWKSQHDNEEVPTARNSFYEIAVVTIANGGDNIAVYTPLFSRTEISLIPLYVLCFLVLTGIWCFLGNYLVTHPSLGTATQRYGKLIFPWFLILLGLIILSSVIFPK
jgi:cadmium resistance protein CadD (predicted permease)